MKGWKVRHLDAIDPYETRSCEVGDQVGARSGGTIMIVQGDAAKGEAVCQLAAGSSIVRSCCCGQVNTPRPEAGSALGGTLITFEQQAHHLEPYQ